MLILAAVLILIISAYFIFDRFYFSKILINDIHKKAVLITGAGGGFGKDLVIRCLHNGMTVFAGCRRDVSVQELKSECSGLPGTLHAFHMDVASEESVQDAKKFVETTLNESNQDLLAVVNNAGVRGNQFCDAMLTMEDYKSVWEVNMFGAVRVCHSFNGLIKKSRGRIIMCTSACVLFSVPGYGPYGSSKAALTAYTDVLRYEMEPFGVRVINVMPGSFETNMQKTENLLNMLTSVWERSSDEAKKEYGEEFIIQAKKAVEDLQGKIISKDSKWVEDTYFHAITAKYPKPVYRIGWDTILFFHPFSLLPVPAQVVVMRLLLWLHGAPTPAAVKR